MLNQAAFNSFVLYIFNDNNQVTRNKFLLQLSVALIKLIFTKRLSCSLKILIKYSIKFFLDEQNFSLKKILAIYG